MRIASLSLIVTGIAICASCEIGPLELGRVEPPQPLPPEDLGTRLTAFDLEGVTGGRVAWSRDGMELLYFETTSSGFKLKAVNASNGSTRVLADVADDRALALGQLRLSADGETLFLSAGRRWQLHHAIFRIRLGSGAVAMLADSVGYSFAVCADESSVAYTTPKGDSIYHLNVTDGAKRAFGVEGGYNQIIGLSPNGSRVVVEVAPGPRSRVKSVSLLDGSIQTIYSFENGFLLGLRWEENEVKLLLAQSGRLFMRDVAKGTDRTIALLPGPPSSVALSPDGGLVAAWVPGRLVQRIINFGELYQYTLHVSDARAGSTKHIGQGNFRHFESPTDLVISPDGRRIAYLRRLPLECPLFHVCPSPSALYVKDVP